MPQKQPSRLAHLCLRFRDLLHEVLASFALEDALRDVETAHDFRAELAQGLLHGGSLRGGLRIDSRSASLSRSQRVLREQANGYEQCRHQMGPERKRGWLR